VQTFAKMHPKKRRNMLSNFAIIVFEIFCHIWILILIW
jgi:hypothetical protein